MDKKACRKCTKEFLLTDYHVDKKNKDGRNSLCKYCRSIEANKSFQRRYKENPQRYRDQANYFRAKLRLEVLQEYGNECKCCGELNKKFLTVDHTNNDGNIHRKSFGKVVDIYRWLKINNYPRDTFQLLCYNCNLGKATNGGICPHKDNENTDLLQS